MNVTKQAAIFQRAGRLFAACVFVGLTGQANAQTTQPASAPQVAPAQAAEPRPTLVVRDAHGNMVRVEKAIELAALEKLTLSEEEKSTIATIVAAREKAIDGALRHATANIPRVARVVEENNSVEVRTRLRELAPSAPMLRDREPFRKALLDVMSTENKTQFVTMLREYMSQASEQAQREARNENKKGTPALMMIAESLRVAAMDVRASLRRVGGLAWPTMRDVLPASGVTEASVRSMTDKLDAFAAAHPDGGSAEDRQDAFVAGLAMLADDQQRLLVDAVYQQFAPDAPKVKAQEKTEPEAAADTPKTQEAQPALQPK